MEGKPSILYSCITRGTLILVKHDQSYEHNFTEVIDSVMENLSSHSDFKTIYEAHGSYLLHVVIVKGIAYICATTPNFNKLRAQRFIQEIITRLKATGLASKVNSAGQYELTGEFGVILGQEMDRYTRMTGFGDLSKLQEQVDEVNKIMIQNIDKVVRRGELLDDLLTKTEDFKATSESFRSTSDEIEKHFSWKDSKATFVIVAAVSVILLAVIVRQSRR